MTDGPGAALLALQDADTALDRIAHARGGLAERVAVGEAELLAVAAKRHADSLLVEVAGATERADTLAADLAAAEKRANDLDQRLRSGESTAARDVVRWSEEVDHLRARAARLEDQAIDALAAKEDLDAALAAAGTALDEAIAAVRDTRGRLAGAEATLDGDAAAVRDRRPGLADAVPSALRDQYERLRTHFGGVGAARLEGGRCSGCHLELSPKDLEDLRRLAPDEVATCEACGRLLVPA